MEELNNAEELKNPKDSLFFKLQELESFSALSEKVEITDSMTLSKIDNLVATAGKIIQSLTHSKLVDDKNRELLKGAYHVKIPRGTELLTKNSGETTGTLVKEGTRNAFKGQATLTERDPSEIISAINPATIAWEVASMVTAQHYMEKIEEELKDLNRKLDSLINLQKNDIVGTLKAIAQEVESLSKYSSENILDRDTRNIKRKSIEDYRVLTNKEFQKANDFLNQNVDYLNSETLKIREKSIAEFQFWTQIQSFSIFLLEELAKLEFQYSPKNANARKQSFSGYEKNVEKAQAVIKKIRAYGIYHTGVKALQSQMLGMNQKKINEKINQPIQELQRIKYEKYDSEELLSLEERPIELIIEDGKVYYLPENSKE